MTTDNGNTTEQATNDKFAQSACNGWLYGVVEWINDAPILDGMVCFDEGQDAVNHATERGDMAQNIGLPISVRYTVVRIHRIRKAI